VVEINFVEAPKFTSSIIPVEVKGGNDMLGRHDEGENQKWFEPPLP